MRDVYEQESAGKATAAHAPVETDTGGRKKLVRAWFDRFEPVALVAALVFYCWSMSPSLLPRPWYLQALATGISMAIGYGLGVAAVWIFRKCGLTKNWSRRSKRVGWWLIAGSAAVVVPAFLVLGSWWQDITREYVGVELGSNWDYAGVFVVASTVFLLALLVVRGLRRVGAVIYRCVDRVLPDPVAMGISVAVVLLVVVLAVEGTVSVGIARIANGSALTVDEGVADGVTAPSEPERSGSPVSPETWDSLGREGRTFVAGGPDAAQIAQVTGAQAKEPIRVYAGRRSVDSSGFEDGDSTAEALARRVVAELERTDAFSRKYLAVATTTGRGWVNHNVAASLEYLSGGDSAIAAMQYSFLASPLAFLADRETPRIAGRALFEAVFDRWSDLPEETRPELLVFGESLGSYGAQDAFSGAQDMIARTDGALFSGTPNFTEQWRRITDSRDTGSREILPVVYGGENVRFASEPSDLEGPELSDWRSPRIVYWQHPSDPIVWWSPELLLDKPDWLNEPRGADVDKGMTWIPFVSFWQVTLDMVFAAEVPYGHGHAYGPEAVFFWADILQLDDPEVAERVFEVLQ